MINTLRRRLRHAQNSFPAGGVLVALLLGYFVYRKVRSGDRVLSWRALAKDGAVLPPARATVQPASQRVTVGETRGFEFTPEAPGELT